MLRRWVLALGFALGVPAGVCAQSLPMELATFEAIGADVTPERVVSGEFDSLFEPVDAASATLPGGFDRSHWLRLTFALPPGDEARAGWILRFDRVPLQRIAAWLPKADGTWAVARDSFYVPSADAGTLPGSYAFQLPHGLDGTRTAYVNVQERHLVTLRPEILTERAFHLSDRRVSGIGAATYSAMLVLMLSSLSLYLALRERTYLYFVGMTAVFGLLMLALNGGLYSIPGLRLFGWWHDHGIYALALVCCVLALGFAKHFLHTEGRPAQRLVWLTRARYGYLVLALLALCNIASLGPTMQRLSAVVGILSAAQIVVMSWQAWRAGNPLARSFLLVWITLGVFIVLRTLIAFALFPPVPLLLDGFQLVMAFCLLLMSVGLADRVLEFRKQRDLNRELKQQTDADLQIEQVRREFAEDLRDRLRMAPPGGELEWVAFRRMLSSLKAILPQRGAAVIAYGYHGLDLVLTDPIDAKERYARLVLERGGTIKGMSRSRTPMQVSFEEQGKERTGNAAMFAVVPMTVPRPGWGALLIERGPEEAFEPEELKRAAEFLNLAVTATDEAVHQAELKKKAEIDQLTGVFNRRAGDTLLRDAMARAIGDRRPLSVLFVDLDHFKQINDRHGHPVGDECLRMAADAIRRQLGELDTVIRYGGEEFLIVLPAHQTDQGKQVGERIRQAIAQLRLDTDTGPVRFSVSIGVASRQAGEDTPQPVVERADRALYAAKRNGRNQVHAASALPYGSGPGIADREDSFTL